MTVVAMGVGNAILGSIAVVVALVGALAAVALLGRVLQPAREIERYSGDILEAGLAIAGNLDGVERLERTQELVRTVPDRASAYLSRLGRRSP